MVQSSISWIDFSDEDRRSMIEVISLLKERDTRDELGLGSIRDALADLLFPGTSTLQTRARYCLFVPWIYLNFEQREVPSSRILERLKWDEVKVLRGLQAAGESEGIIGQRSGISLHRFPSSIYWNGLRRWNILRYSGSRDQYHRSLDGFYHRQRNRLPFEDEVALAGWQDANWDPSLPPRPDGFPEQASFQLQPKEAAYLRERLLLSCPDCLLTTLVDQCRPVDGVDDVWQHPQVHEFPVHQQAWLVHARNLSATMWGAVLLYNLMLAELRNDEELVGAYQDTMDTWRAEIHAGIAELRGWDRRDFWQLVTNVGRIPWPTQRFVNAWLDLALGAGVSAHLTDHPQARALIREREVWLKGGRSRFESRRHLEMWSGAAGLAPLDYRWRVARRIVDDIQRGLEVE